MNKVAMGIHPQFSTPSPPEEEHSVKMASGYRGLVSERALYGIQR